MPKLPLLDPRKRFSFDAPKRRARGIPRISIPGVFDPAPIPEKRSPSPDDPVSAERLCRRLHALQRALDDLHGHARRMARWRAKHDLAPASEATLEGANNRYSRLPPMRPGWPPGRRKRHRHEVDEILRECHSLALYSERSDTS